MVLYVILNEDNISTTMMIERDKRIKDVFGHIYKKYKKFNPKEYIIKSKLLNEEELSEVDPNMPVQ